MLAKSGVLSPYLDPRAPTAPSTTSFARYRAESGEGKPVYHMKGPSLLISYRNTDLLPAMPGSEAQDSPGPPQLTPEVHTSQTESPQQDTVVVATDYEPPQWNRPGEADDHVSSNHLPQTQSDSPDETSLETITIGHEAAGYDAVMAPATEVNQSEQMDTFDTPASSAIANDTSAWAESLEEGESHGDRVPFYPGTQPSHEP